MDEDIRVVAGEGGWCRVTGDNYEAAVRFDPDLHIAAYVVEFAVSMPLRLVAHLAQIEAWAVEHGESLRPGIKARLALDPFERDALDAAHLAEPARRVRWGTGPEAEMRHDASVAALVAPAGLALVLCVPPDHFKPRAFYEDVAGLYAALLPATSNPAVLIADANGVDPSLVRRWVKEARRRGLLAPGKDRTR